MPLHPPSLKQKQSSITPLPLSSPKNMFDPKYDHVGRRCSDHGVNCDSTAQNYANYSMEGESCEVSTSPLWTPPHPHNVNYRCLSPTSKAHAIARGQRELMEMVSRMPESCYELSLKDLVEHQPPKQEAFGEGTSVINEDVHKEQKDKRPQIKTNGSIDNGGFLLKMVFPFSFGSRKKMKKKKKNDSNAKSKVSPKPSVSDASGGEIVDKEWWKKRPASSESENEIESGGYTMNSGSTKSSSSSCRSMTISNSNQIQRHESNGCLAFIRARKSTSSR